LVVAKAVAGFMNHAGGILVIGVSDDRQILGIEKDLETLTKKNLDGFQMAFKDVVKIYIGLEHLVHTHLHFENLDGHVVCAIVVEKSSRPVYVKNGENHEFYVRTLNSTYKLSLPQTVDYIRSRWG
jgi:predicted HTH transcriptional regulator